MRTTHLLLLLVCLAALTPSGVWGSSGHNYPDTVFMNKMTVSPNPVPVGEAVNIVIELHAKGTEPQATLTLGDGTSQTFTTDTVATLKAGLTHTYAASGVYLVRVVATNGPFTARGSVYVVVGRGNVINAFDGTAMSVTDEAGAARQAGAGSRYAGGVVRARLIPTRHQTTVGDIEFEDPSGVPTKAGGLTGTKVYTHSGLFLATGTLGSSTFPTGKVRKMLAIGSRDVGDSAALADPPSFDIKIKKIQGKVAFVGEKEDAISFSGTIQLPAGFNPARPGGNTLSIGLGNIIDTITVDEKGKATLPSAKGRLKSAKIKFPKLDGAAAGGEQATIDATIVGLKLSEAGLDTEGITDDVNNDEFALKAVSRQVQVSILLNGVPYETLSNVEYKLKRNRKTFAGEAGQFKNIVNRTSR